jgi:hypothetical protein
MKFWKTSSLAAVVLIGLSCGAAAPGTSAVLVGLPNSPGYAQQAERFDLLGGASGGDWITHQTLKLSPSSYELWNLTGKVGSVRGGAKTSFSGSCADAYTVSLKPAPDRQNWWVAVDAPWNPRPRSLTLLPNDNAAYKAVVKDFLTAKGLKNPGVHLEHVLSADLDGDGRDETIIGASRFNLGTGVFPPESGQTGDYSLLLVQKTVAGKVKTFELGSDIFPTPTTAAQTKAAAQQLSERYALVNLLDLNGDGKMEVVMVNAGSEAYRISAMGWDGQTFKPRLETECGP